jgi:formylglycine-generating enzyme required for sulfatase activity
VLVPLSAWSSDAESCDPFDWTERESRFVEDGQELAGLAAALRAEAEAGRAWLLFDGLDEVAKEDRPRVLARVRELARKHEGAVVLVTSRPAAAERGELSGFQQARLLPLRDRDQRRLLTGWVGADAAARALRQIEERPRMEELARNPLLLTLLAKLVEQGPELWDLDPELPRNRGGLYERALDLLLRRGYAKARKEGVKDPHAATELLARLSLELQREGGEGWPRKRVIERTWSLAKQDASLWPYFKPWDDAPQRFVDDVGLNSGVLGPHDGPGAHWRYLHRSLREYLAAKAMVAGCEEDLVARLKEDTARWGEVTALVCGLLGRDDPRREALIEELVSSDHDLATRTLPQLEGLGVEEALELLERVPEDYEGERWDGDDLRRLLTGLVLENHAPDEIRAAVMAHVSAELSTQELAYRLYALESARLPIDRATFFRACDRWPETGEPEPPPMVRIPPGAEAEVSFVMGSPEDEPGRDDDEGPQHPVSLAAFLLAETPVTETLYARFEDGAESDLPKIDLSWWEAWLYCRWIGGQLPTEAQWECACRAGTTTAFSTGVSLTTRQANVGRKGEGFDFHNECTPVRSCAQNPWGLFDMHGNVLEWCADWFGSYESLVREGDALRQVPGTVFRVYRGGSFLHPARRARSAYRDGGRPRNRHGYLGFRPAKGITPA